MDFNAKINSSYFSLSSLFRNYIKVNLTAKECQFLAKGLKYATDKYNLLPIKKRRDPTLYNNYSSQYDYKLMEYAVALYVDYDTLIKPHPKTSSTQKNKIIENLAKQIIL